MKGHDSSLFSLEANICWLGSIDDRSFLKA
jgi:hypothetical protein